MFSSFAFRLIKNIFSSFGPPYPPGLVPPNFVVRTRREPYPGARFTAVLSSDIHLLPPEIFYNFENPIRKFYIVNLPPEIFYNF
nr:MAG TPA: hypothetical protein [Caudoviricetes sp.]